MEVYRRVYLHFENAHIENVCICLDLYFLEIFQICQLLCFQALYGSLSHRYLHICNM